MKNNSFKYRVNPRFLHLWRVTHIVCISCNICLTACPVVRATQRYRGPKLNGPALTRLRKLTGDYDPMIRFCSNCKNCDRVCPSGTPISALNMKARALHFKDHSHDVADQLLSRNELMGKTLSATPLSAQSANLGMKIACATGLIKILGLNPDAPFPKYAKKSFYQRFKHLKQEGNLSREVLFYPGCYVNYNEPELGELIVRLLNYQGVRVLIDKRLKCCGSPLLSTGYLGELLP